MTERTIVDMGTEPMARVIDYLRSCVEGQIESIASAIQEGEPQYVLIELTHNIHLLFSEYQRALNGTMEYGMAMSWWEQIEISEIEEGLGNDEQDYR